MDWKAASADEGKLSDLNRFLRLVEIGEKDECWEWKGNAPDDRHGHFSVRAKAVKAHRWIYALCCGQIPDGMVIRHKCDNPKCVNPLHLTIGRPVDNVADMHERGRNADRRGEKHPLSKITAEMVLAIRQASSLGKTQRAIAAEYGISNQHVGKIVRRENWKHV